MRKPLISQLDDEAMGVVGQVLRRLLFAVSVSCVGSSPDILSICPSGGEVFSRTLHEAQARLALSARPRAPVVLELCSGRHPLPAALVLGPDDPGVVEIRGAPGAQATLDSGVRVTGWRRLSGRIWQAPMPRGAGPCAAPPASAPSSSGPS